MATFLRRFLSSPLPYLFLPLLFLLPPPCPWTSLPILCPRPSTTLLPSPSSSPCCAPSLVSAQPLHLPRPRSAQGWGLMPVHRRHLHRFPLPGGPSDEGEGEAQQHATWRSGLARVVPAGAIPRLSSVPPLAEVDGASAHPRRPNAARAGAGSGSSAGYPEENKAGCRPVASRSALPLLPLVAPSRLFSGLVHRDLMAAGKSKHAAARSSKKSNKKKKKKAKKKKKKSMKPSPNPPPTPSPPPPLISPDLPGKVGSRTLGLSLQGPAVSSPRFHNPWMKYSSVGLNVPPGGKPTLNVSFYVDLRPLLSPPADQDRYYYCGACWAFSAAGAVEGAMAAMGTSLGELSAEELVECALGDCSGGYSTDAFEHVASHDLVTNASFPYTGSGSRTCDLPSGAHGQRIRFYETVDLLGPLGLLIAVQYQPVVVQVEADQDSFYNYNGSIFRDSNCFANQYANHEMLLVGYSFNGNLNSPDNYFILKNSWGTSWGDKGYMYMAIAPLSPFGMCGIWSGTNSYPVLPALPSEPCKFFPCGAGQCIPRTDQVLPGQSAYTCNCTVLPFLFIALNIDNSSTCVSRYVCVLKQGNPCGVGTCLDDSGGGYTCRCPNYYSVGRLAHGDITCVPSPAPVATYTVLNSDTCSIVCVTLGVSLSSFLTLNPALNCDSLAVGSVVLVPAPAVKCEVFFHLDRETTCDGVLDQFTLNYTTLLTYNPALDCSALQPGLPVCVAEEDKSSGDTFEPFCSKYAIVAPGDTCDSIQAANNLTASDFFVVNQGIQCSQLPTGARVCVQGGTTRTTKAGSSSCKKTYTVKSKDDCTGIFSSYYSGNAGKFQSCNKATCTSSYLYTGRVLCIC